MKKEIHPKNYRFVVYSNKKAVNTQTVQIFWKGNIGMRKLNHWVQGLSHASSLTKWGSQIMKSPSIVLDLTNRSREAANFYHWADTTGYPPEQIKAALSAELSCLGTVTGMTQLLGLHVDALEHFGGEWGYAPSCKSIRYQVLAQFPEPERNDRDTKKINIPAVTHDEKCNEPTSASNMVSCVEWQTQHIDNVSSCDIRSLPQDPPSQEITKPQLVTEFGIQNLSQFERIGEEVSAGLSELLAEEKNTPPLPESFQSSLKPSDLECSHIRFQYCPERFCLPKRKTSLFTPHSMSSFSVGQELSVTFSSHTEFFTSGNGRGDSGNIFDWWRSSSQKDFFRSWLRKPLDVEWNKTTLDLRYSLNWEFR